MGLDLGKPIGTEALEGEGSRSTRVNDVDMWTVFMARRKHWEEKKALGTKHHKRCLQVTLEEVPCPRESCPRL